MLKIDTCSDQAIETQSSRNDVLIGSNSGGWSLVHFGDAVDFHKGLTYKSEDYCEKGKGIIFFNLRCVGKNGGFNSDGVKYYNGLTQNNDFIVPGDIVIANTDLTRDGDIIGCPVEIPEYYKDEAVCISMDLTKIVPNKKLDKKFCYYFLQLPYCRKFMRSHSSGSTVLHLNLNSVKKLLLPLPPLYEQRKIAAILSSVDAAIEQTDAIIAQTERMKKGLMQELLTKGIKHTVFKKTSIGRIPEKWDVIYLGNNNYFDLVAGGTPSTKNKRYWENGDILWLLSGEIHKKRIYDTQKKISKLGYENSNATLLPKQSVLIALAGQGKTRGTTAITEIELTTNQSVAAIISNFNYLNSYYVYYVLDSMYEELRSKSSGSGRAGLSLTILREIGLPLPSLSEQNQIASTLLSVDDKLIIEKNRRIQLGRLKKSLMQDLLTGRVRVKVDDHV